MSVLRLVSSAALALLVAGCAMIPPEPVVTGRPRRAPPPPPSTPAQPTGSIYQPTAYGNHPLFEDRRPRNVGDIVTIVLNERTNASKNVATNTNRSGSANLGIAAAPSFMDSWARRPRRRRSPRARSSAHRLRQLSARIAVRATWATS